MKWKIKEARMGGFLVNILVILVLGWLFLRRGRDRSVDSVPAARWLRIAALVLLAMPMLIYLLFGVAEMAGGDLSGAWHLLQLAVLALLAVLAWLRPLEGGIGLAVTGAVSTAAFIAALASEPPSAEPTALSPALWIVAAPLILSGVLFFIAGVLGRRTAARTKEIP